MIDKQITNSKSTAVAKKFTQKNYRKELNKISYSLSYSLNCPHHSLGYLWTPLLHSPPQFMILRTAVVDRILRLRRKSASWPPIGTTIVITMCGTAERIPTYRQCHPVPISTGVNASNCTFERNEECSTTRIVSYWCIQYILKLVHTYLIDFDK